MSPVPAGDIGQVQSQLIIVTGLWRKHFGVWQEQYGATNKRNGAAKGIVLIIRSVL
jgi:hypothetical protein